MLAVKSCFYALKCVKDAVRAFLWECSPLLLSTDDCSIFSPGPLRCCRQRQCRTWVAGDGRRRAFVQTHVTLRHWELPQIKVATMSTRFFGIFSFFVICYLLSRQDTKSLLLKLRCLFQNLIIVFHEIPLTPLVTNDTCLTWDKWKWQYGVWRIQIHWMKKPFHYCSFLIFSTIILHLLVWVLCKSSVCIVVGKCAVWYHLGTSALHSPPTKGHSWLVSHSCHQPPSRAPVMQ